MDNLESLYLLYKGKNHNLIPRKYTIGIWTLLLFLPTFLFAQPDFYQNESFTRQDTLRGMLLPERTCFDVTFYELDLKLEPEKKFIKGFVDIQFRVLDDFEIMQLDLFENMQLNEVTWQEGKLDFQRDGNAFYVHFPKKLEKDSQSKIRVHYEGVPTIARKPPWDGGFVWRKDSEGVDWIGVACEGDGASLWWPNKDHLSDEPDSMMIKVAVPNHLKCIANGNLISVEEQEENYSKWNWKVSYPINNYNVSLNIANYAHFEDTFVAQDGDSLQMDFYVLPINLEKAKKQFKQVHGALAAFEYYFDKYPFWNDGLAFIETPYLGMEHQSAIAYGNKYMRGYMGGMIPKDMNWDYIIVHELGHEWFGNSISSNDHAEMWIHESFTTYMEALYVEHQYGYKDAVRYLKGQKSFIRNKEPILGPLDVNWKSWNSSDHYFKGSWVLHTLRHAINNDEKWRGILKGFYMENKISHVTTTDFIDYVNEATGKDWTAFFQQYLGFPSIPTLLYEVNQDKKDLIVKFKWNASVDSFDMPLLVGKEGSWTQIHPSTQKINEVVIKNIKKEDFKIALDLFYIKAKQINF